MSMSERLFLEAWEMYQSAQLSKNIFYPLPATTNYLYITREGGAQKSFSFHIDQYTVLARSMWSV